MERTPRTSRRFISALVTLRPSREPCVECALNFEAGLCRCRRDEFDDGSVVCELFAPVLRDTAEQAVFDLVPFRSAWRIMPDLDREAGLVGELLQLHFQSRTRAPFEPPQSAVIVSSRAFG